MKSDDYIEIAYKRIEDDRSKLEKLYKELDEVGENEGEVDPIAKLAASDNLVKVVDSLAKQTGQVVELAKLKQKAEGKSKEDDGFDEDDYEDMYSAIESAPDKEVYKS